jgi:hypothetical protein
MKLKIRMNINTRLTVERIARDNIPSCSSQPAKTIPTEDSTADIAIIDFAAASPNLPENVGMPAASKSA